MILDRPNCFGLVQIVLVMSKSFWAGPNHFGQVQIRLFWTIFYNMDLSKMIWTRPKRIGPVQNNWYSTKMIWLVQNNFEAIEGQGIKELETYPRNIEIFLVQIQIGFSVVRLIRIFLPCNLSTESKTLLLGTL